MAKEKLSKVLKENFAKMGLTISEVGPKVNIPSESLRVILSRNRFAISRLLALVKLVGLPEDIETLKKDFVFDLTVRSNTKQYQVPSDLMPIIKAIAATDIETLSMGEFDYLLLLQKNFTQPITSAFIEEAMRLR